MSKLDAKRREAAAKLSRPKPIELPSGKWRCQIMVGGERIDVVDDDPVTAHAKALAYKAGLLERERPPASITVGQAIDRYIESKDAVLSPSTVAGYKRVRKNALQELMPMQLASLTPEIVQRAVNRMARSKSPKSVQNAHGLLSAALSVYRPSLILRTTLPRKQKYEASIPSVDEIQKILGVARGGRMELPILLAIWLGLRASEIRGITWDCIDGDVIHIRTAIVEGEDGPAVKDTKTYSGNRKIRLPVYIRSLIEQQPRTDEYVIHQSGQAIYKGFCRVCEKAGVPHFRFHDLRHGNASIMLALGIPDKYAMERMGHATNNMLKSVYQHTMDEKRKTVDDLIDDYFAQNLQSPEFHMNLHMDEEKP